MTILQSIVFIVACLAVFLLPGALLARRSRLLWSRLGPGEKPLPAFLLSAGVYSLVYLLSQALSPSLNFATAVWLLCLGILILWNLSDLRRRFARSRAPVRSASRGRGPHSVLLPSEAEGRLSLAVLPLLLFALVLMLIQGGRLGFMHDSLDFVSFVNRMLLTDRIDLASGAFLDTGDTGPDPRRGAFHLAAALLCRFSGAQPADMWRLLPVFLVPTALWTFFAAFRRILRSASVAYASLAVFMAITLLSGDHFLNNLAYASRIGWVYSWIGLWALSLYLDEDRADHTPPADWTPRLLGGHPGLAAWLLAIGCAPILLGIHVLSAAQYLISLAAFAWIWALSDREPIPIRKQLLFLPLLAAAALFPFLVLKLARSYASSNPLFDHPQGLLYVARDWPVLGPRHLISWFGWPGLLGVVLSIPLIRDMRRHRDRAFLVASTWITFLIVLNPLAVRAVEEVKGHSLLFRVLLVAPFFQVLGWYIDWARRRLLRDRSARRLLPVGIFLLLLVLAFAQHTGDALQSWREPEHRRAALVEPPEALRAFAFLDSALAEPRVILSDPITSYAVPAYTRHYAMTPFHQHSSPADARTVERMQDAMAVLSAYVPLGRTVELLRQYNVSHVLINQSFERYQSHYYTLISPVAYEAQRRKFDSHPGLFEPFYDRDGILVYRFLDPGPDAAIPDTLESPNPHLVLNPDEAGGRDGLVLARELRCMPYPGPAVGGMQLIGIRPDSTRLDPGGVFTGDSYWRRTDEPYVLPVAAFLRFETRFPHPWFDHPWIGRVFRSLYEARHGATYRFGRDLRPLDHIYPAYLWEPGAVYKAPIYVPIPLPAAAGAYTVRARPYEVPFNPNFYLTDLFRLRDSLDGRPVLLVTVGD